LAFVGDCGELWAISEIDAFFFGVLAGFLGVEAGQFEQKRRVEDGKMCG
jgi:hypothetical protein